MYSRLSPRARADIIGRRQRDNVELDAALVSAHVKRTVEENFTPAAFVLRHSMPWVDSDGVRLMFVAFGKSFYAFEAELRRMAGEDDQIGGARFAFTHQLPGSDI